ncbi:hypothetical protein AB0D04_08730 [Streptomyces sp. NPDC048483]|uniref:hypothetical protein n=1 Tax=Streptomyces sp. NPDC048483 TaxID=3154927 RepID=UPI00341AA86A
MASHARPRPSRIPRTLLRTALAVSAAGAALAAGGSAAASASPAPAAHTDQGAADTAPGLAGVLGNSVSGAPSAVKHLPVNPWANTEIDPLNNGVSTEIADFKPVSTTMLTGPLSRGGTMKDVPVVGEVAHMLPESGPAAPDRAPHPSGHRKDRAQRP